METTNAALLKEIDALNMRINNLKKTVEDQQALIDNAEQDRRYFQALMESIPAGIFLTDKDGKMLKVSDFTKRVWGTSIRLSGNWREYSDWKGYNPVTGKKLSAEEWAAARALRGEIIPGEIIDIERFDGTRGTIINSASPVKDEADNIIGAITVNIDISNQRQAEVALRESREKYQSLVETNVDFIWEIDCEGKYTYCGPQMEILCKINPADMIGKTPADSVKPEYKDKVTRMIKKLMKNPSAFYNLKSEALDATGRTVYIDISGVPFYGQNGELCGYRGVTRDITERTLTEEALVESNRIAQQHLAEIENIYKTVSVGLAVIDLNARYLRINDMLAQINGVPAKDHIGKTINEIVPSLHDQVSKTISLIVRTGQPLLGIEFQGVTKDEPGVMRYFSEDWLPLRDKSGKIIAINVAVVETTEQKKAHENILRKQNQLSDAKRALQRTQKKLNMALAIGRTGIWELDLNTHKFTVDERMIQMFDIKSRIATMEDLDWFIHEEDVQYVRDALRNTLSNGDLNEITFRTNPHNGPIRYISSRALLNKDRKGNSVKVTGVCFDITGFARESEKNLMKLNQELQRSNKDLEQFAYIASHDLQEPLRMVASFTQLLQLKYADKLDSDANEFIKYAVDGSRRMYEMLNSLLAYSRVKTKFSGFTTVDMNGIFALVLDNLRLRVKETGAEIITGDLPVITADGSQMIQLMQNLIENALKFNSGKPVIHVSYINMERFHSFSVQDNGIGIEEQYHDKIFRIFQRLHVKEYCGTGIGLAICKRIIERHGGKIWVESGPDQGCVFTFTIFKDLQA